MNRRSLLVSLAALVFDPERDLWLPGKKLVSIPTWPRRFHVDVIPYVHSYAVPMGNIARAIKTDGVTSWIEPLAKHGDYLEALIQPPALRPTEVTLRVNYSLLTPAPYRLTLEYEREIGQMAQRQLAGTPGK